MAASPVLSGSVASGASSRGSDIFTSTNWPIETSKLRQPCLRRRSLLANHSIFDLAVQVKDETTEIVAPRSGPGPKWEKKTDRRRCIAPLGMIGGRAVLHHIMIWKEDRRLFEVCGPVDSKRRSPRTTFADRMAQDLHATIVDCGDRTSKNRYRRDMVEVDEQRVNPPDAKKPRLERSDQPELHESLASRPMGDILLIHLPAFCDTF
jgi:hypothetical protein